jgi:trigger factor
MDFIKDVTIEQKEHSEVSITGEIPYAELEKERAKTLRYFGKDMKVDGFRPGHIPEKVIIERVGEMALLSDMAERALARIYPEILKAHTIDAIGHPKISITKIAPQNPLGFTALVATLPTVTLPKVKDIASHINSDKASAEVTDEDLEKQINDILRQKVAYDRLQAKAKAKDESGDLTLPTPETVDAPEEEGEPTLPDLTDELVATLGQPGQFTTVADFKEKVREHLSIEKSREVHAHHRAKITDAIIEATEIDIPRILIDSELEQMFAKINETKEDLATEWTPAAEKRAKLQLVLNEIAKQEHITADEALVNEQVALLKEQYKDADETRVRIYVTSILQNEAVMNMLETQGIKSDSTEA